MLNGKLPFEGTTVQDTMVKRLTDDPAKLGDARPDLRFPAGLQGTLDAALTRSPVDRYQATAKFAHDVARIVGVERGPGGPSVPATRSNADAKTELLAPVRKRSLMPILVGVVVVLGGAGTAVALRGGGKQADGATPADTAPRVGAGQRLLDSLTVGREQRSWIRDS